VTILWNDVEILRFVDACDKGERSLPRTGSDLARALAADRGVDVEPGDYAPFLHELAILLRAHMLMWGVPNAAHIRQPTPDEPQRVLDHMWKFELTQEGRDHAKRPVIYESTPDPAEDDGREIRYLTLKDIANIIGHDYPTPFEVLQFFADSGISREDIDFTYISDRPVAYANHMLHAKATGTRRRRRELRSFIGAWLDDQLHTGPSDDERDRIDRDLARQGWIVRDGRLVIGDPVRRGPGTQPTAPTADQLHAIVWDAAAAQWKAGHLHDALMAASKAVNAMLEAKVGRSDVSEVKLVTEAFSEKPPTDGARRLRFPNIEGEQTRASVTVGVLSFGVGCFKAIRNPLGHLPDDQHDITEQEAFEQLAAWSLFARWIDRATLSTET
jgi:hypothetical protein